MKEIVRNANVSSAFNKHINPKSICVVGSGPVGLACALRLANTGQAVTLIDSGDFASQDQGREFYLGTVVSAAKAEDRSDPNLIEGTLYTYLDREYLAYSRNLRSGGTSWAWGIQWRPSAEGRVRIVPGALADFEARPDFGIPAWAAPAADVYNRYEDALEFFDLASHSFKVDAYQDSLHPVPQLNASLPTKLFHFARANVIRHQRMDDVIAHPGIDVYSGLHLVRIETDYQKRVTALIACSQDGSEIRIEAEHYILALGGIENTRQLLLAKNDGALSDPHDVFGRWFCDHPHVRLGYLNQVDNTAFTDVTAWYDFQEIQGTPILRGHELEPNAAREFGLLRFSIDLVGRPDYYCSQSGVSMAKALDALKSRDGKALVASLSGLASSPTRLLQLAHHAKNTAHGTYLGGWSDPSMRLHSAESLAVEAMFEQCPSPDNRVRLGTKYDRLGRQLPVLQWSWSRKEVDSINQSTEFMAEAFKKSGVGSFVTMRDLGQGEIPRGGSGFHHMGGTRQSDDPAEGVVDANNRVHGVENLTLIGSSIFPNTVGYANPTLTAVADALRVADLLAQ